MPELSLFENQVDNGASFTEPTAIISGTVEGKEDVGACVNTCAVLESVCMPSTGLT
jgi:hypothetical protein